MDSEDGEDGDREEATATAAANDTSTVDDCINNRSFPCEDTEDGAKSAVATVPCQHKHGAHGTNKKMHGKEGGGNKDDENDNGAAASNVSSGGRNCEGGNDDTDDARIFRRPVVETRPGPVGKGCHDWRQQNTQYPTSQPDMVPQVHM